jgi:hypothetical protein
VPPIPRSNRRQPSFLDDLRHSRRKDSVFQVIHVRGTPTSGKSMLARLLHGHIYTVRPDMEFNWPPVISGEFQHKIFHHLLNDITRKPVTIEDDWLGKQNTVLIVDDAYEYLNLWDEFIKPLASND